MRKARAVVERRGMCPFATLLRELGEPCRIELSADLWRASAILAGLRVSANDPIRAADRNRGAEKNYLADIWGVIGELVALRRLQELTNAAVTHCPIVFDRAVDEVDLRVRCEDAEVLLEAKAHFVQAGKSWFMVNARAHERSLRRGAVGYIPVLTAMGARRALVGSMLTTAGLERWGPPNRRLRDPAIGVPLASFSRAQFGRTLHEAEQLIDARTLAAEDQLSGAASQAGLRLPTWRTRLPALGSLRAKEVVEAVLLAERDIDASA